MLNESQDKKLKCEICGKTFIFSKGEQEFFKEKGLTNIPKTCPECRRKKKAGEKIIIKQRCSICGKWGSFRKRIEAQELICDDCYSKIKKKR